MRFEPFVLAAVLALFCAAPALAAPTDTSSGAAASSPTPAAAAATPPKPAPGSPDEVVCKREEETGTRLGGHKECHTRREWTDMEDQTETGMDQVERRNVQPYDTPGEGKTGM